MLGRILGAGASFPAYAFLEVFDLGDALRHLMTGTIDALMATVTWVRVRVKSRDSREGLGASGGEGAGEGEGQGQARERVRARVSKGQAQGAW